MSKAMTSGKCTALLIAAILLASGGCKKSASVAGTGGTGSQNNGSAGTSGTGTATGASGTSTGTSGTSTGGSAAGASAGSAGSAHGTGGSSNASAGSGAAGGGAAGAGATCPQCIDMPISFGLTGGFVAYTDLSAFAACGHYVHMRTASSGGAAGAAGAKPIQCANDAPCSGASVITPGMVKDALANADVKQSLTGTMASGTVLYGVDTRPADGSVYQFRIGYSTVQVGGPCAGQAGCNAIPTGVQALVDLLKALDKQQLGMAPCSAAFPQG